MTGWQGTPGPWAPELTHGCKRIFGPYTGRGKLELACTSGLCDDGEDQANADGIAAVPELVEALIEARKIVTATVARIAMHRTALNAIDTALAKAGVKL